MKSINFKQGDLKKDLDVCGVSYRYYSLDTIYTAYENFKKLPFSLKVLLENALRHAVEQGPLGQAVENNDVGDLIQENLTQENLSQENLIQAFDQWLTDKTSRFEIPFKPARILMQDFTGVPAIVDLATMRDAMKALNQDPAKINPLVPVDLVIDHSVMVDSYGDKNSLSKDYNPGSVNSLAINVAHEYQRNQERYRFLKWGQTAFRNFRVVPPGAGICHQVNLEYLAQVVWCDTQTGESILYPDTLVGTDSHTTMVNALGVMGWGVGGIEAEAAMLGQPISLILPEVIGVNLSGQLKEGVTATDLVLTITSVLRHHGVVGKFVEFYGTGLDELSLADRATISNMSPEFGATCAMFPIDDETLRYLRFTGRDPHQVELVKTYAQIQGLWRDSDKPEAIYTNTVHVDLSSIEPLIAGPKRPQDKIPLSQAAVVMHKALQQDQLPIEKSYPIEGLDSNSCIKNGDVVIAAITSCTNTSNPAAMIGAGLIAKRAVERGLKVMPWVKTSLAPGSQVVTDYLVASNLQPYLNQLGFNLVGYGCTTCIGNSGPLDPAIADVIASHKMGVCAVLSGNRNFEGRIHQQVRYSYLASPMLVVLYALTGTLSIDLTTQAIGTDPHGQPVFLKDLWPTNAEIQQAMTQYITPSMFNTRYQQIFSGDAAWQELGGDKALTYNWDDNSTYIRRAPYFSNFSPKPKKTAGPIQGRILGIFGDSITTDHISPAGAIKESSPAGQYLINHGIDPKEFNSYGSRRGNHEVMIRGTFANTRLVNEMLDGQTGGLSRLIGQMDVASIFDVAMQYQQTRTPLIIIAGRDYGSGSSRDWAAKGTKLLGVTAVIAESFERIHRSNLIGMGVLPLQFQPGDTRKTLKLTGDETIEIPDLINLKPQLLLPIQIKCDDKTVCTVNVTVRIDTNDELEYYQNNGILQYVLRNIIKTS